MKRKLSTVVIWLVTALFAFSFALPAWAAWIRLFVIHNGNPFAPAVSRFAVFETVDPVLEQASILSSLWTTPTLFFLLLLCLAVRRESPRTMLFTIYFSLAAGFALLFLPLCFPAAHHPVTYISLENLLFYWARGSQGLQCIFLLGPVWLLLAHWLPRLRSGGPNALPLCGPGSKLSAAFTWLSSIAFALSLSFSSWMSLVWQGTLLLMPEDSPPYQHISDLPGFWGWADRAELHRLISGPIALFLLGLVMLCLVLRRVSLQHFIWHLYLSFSLSFLCIAATTWVPLPLGSGSLRHCSLSTILFSASTFISAYLPLLLLCGVFAPLLYAVGLRLLQLYRKGKLWQRQNPI